MNTIIDVDLAIPGSPSLVIRALSELATLPFIASFDVQDMSTANVTSAGTNGKRPSRVTYIGLTKKAMPLLVDLFMRFKDNVDLYVDETLEAMLSVSWPIFYGFYIWLI